MGERRTASKRASPNPSLEGFHHRARTRPVSWLEAVPSTFPDRLRDPVVNWTVHTGFE